MAYIVSYIKDFGDIDKVVDVCRKDLNLGYKVKIFTDTENSCDISLENVTFAFCDDPMEQAVKSAKELYAEKCKFYMHHAIYSVDPKLYDYAEKVRELDYEEAQELSVNGYNAISYSVIDLAKRGSVRLEVLTLDDPEGTTIKEVSGVGEKLIKSMSKDTDIAIVTLTEIPDCKGSAYHIVKTLSDEDFYIDAIMLPAVNGNSQDISFCIRATDADTVKKMLNLKKEQLGFKAVLITTEVAKISVMGAGFHLQKGIAAKLLEVLYRNDIDIKTIFTSEVKISVVVDKAYADKAVREIHRNLIGK